LQSCDPAALSGRKGVLRGYFELLRPPNVMTAIADVLAGYAVAGRGNPRALPWLVAATACLYAGGVVLNDYFDRELDAVERPERPLPSGRVRPGHARALGAALLVAGVATAAVSSRAAGAFATIMALTIVVYDIRGKHHGVLGPLNMGLCRGLNLVLGIAAVPAAIRGHWALGLLAFVYIAAVTVVSRGEVQGGKRGPAALALISLGGVLLALTAIALRAGVGTSAVAALAITLLLAWRVLPPFWLVYRNPGPVPIRQAVKAGVLSLVLLDASLAAAYAGPLYAAVVLSTAVVAAGLARLFSVT
jgi:4-hydroxybenzoate polyprenyltransferase